MLVPALEAAIWEQGKWTPATGKVHADITLYVKRKQDVDNSHGCLKLLIDSMKLVGLIVDDREKWFSYTVRQETSQDQRVVIELKTVREADND